MNRIRHCATANTSLTILSFGATTRTSSSRARTSLTVEALESRNLLAHSFGSFDVESLAGVVPDDGRGRPAESRATEESRDLGNKTHRLANDGWADGKRNSSNARRDDPRRVPRGFGREAQGLRLESLLKVASQNFNSAKLIAAELTPANITSRTPKVGRSNLPVSNTRIDLQATGSALASADPFSLVRQAFEPLQVDRILTEVQERRVGSSALGSPLIESPISTKSVEPNQTPLEPSEPSRAEALAAFLAPSSRDGVNGPPLLPPTSARFDIVSNAVDVSSAASDNLIEQRSSPGTAAIIQLTPMEYNSGSTLESSGHLGASGTVSEGTDRNRLDFGGLIDFSYQEGPLVQSLVRVVPTAAPDDAQSESDLEDDWLDEFFSLQLQEFGSDVELDEEMNHAAKTNDSSHTAEKRADSTATAQDMIAAVPSRFEDASHMGGLIDLSAEKIGPASHRQVLADSALPEVIIELESAIGRAEAFDLIEPNADLLISQPEEYVEPDATSAESEAQKASMSQAAALGLPTVIASIVHDRRRKKRAVSRGLVNLPD